MSGNSRDLEPDPSGRIATELGRADALPPLYELVRLRLTAQGWAQGTECDPDGRVSLSAAIAAVITMLEPNESRRLGRIARASNRLRSLASTSHLEHWNDASDRTINDVEQLLLDAAVAYMDD